MPDEPTLGEVSRSLSTVSNQLTEVKKALESGYVRSDIYTERSNNISTAINTINSQLAAVITTVNEIALIKSDSATLKAQFDAMKNGQTWLIRAVAGALIVALVGLIINFMKVAP